MDARMMYLHAISPVHTGTGQAVDVIDLPVAREVTTGWPYIPGSSIKGVLRALCDPGKGADKENERRPFIAAFGPDADKADEGAGALLFGDGRLLCLPVRSLFGAFAWLTCPLSLDRYRRDHRAAGLATPPDASLKLEDSQIALPSMSRLKHTDGKVYLEDLDLEATDGDSGVDDLCNHIARAVFAAAEDTAWREPFTARFGVVSDTTFSFLSETCTEVTARIRMDSEKKTVAGGALWYEEAIPAESIFSAPLLAAPRNGGDSAPHFNLVTAHLDGAIQIGGNASVGRGLMRVTLRESQS